MIKNELSERPLCGFKQVVHDSVALLRKIVPAIDKVQSTGKITSKVSFSLALVR